jgi:hypothetical protein
MATIVTVFGDEAELYVETSEQLTGPVEVTYTPTSARQGTQSVKLPEVFKEQLTAVASPLRPPPNTEKFASRIKWTVNMGQDVRGPLLTVNLKATVVGTSASGRKFVVTAVDELLVVGVSVTTDPKLTRIMLHEFSTDQGAASVFDPDPCERFSALLTTAQRKLLLARVVANPAGRMVAFVTFYDPNQKARRMRADMFDVAVRANASFTVFHCEDFLKRGITLVCHTEHLVVNFFNPSTRAWITSPVGGAKGRMAQEYMTRSTANPIQYKLGVALPIADHDAAIYFVVCQADGKSIMGRNYLHGIVNTHGCWMLFRNFNWPRDKADAFELLYRQDRKDRVKDVPGALAALGYDDPGQAPARSSSVVKWWFYDRNFAYAWFCHEVVGIQYFGNLSWIEREGAGPKRPFPQSAPRVMHEHNTHQRVFEKGMDLTQPGAWRSFQSGFFAYHDAGDSPGFKATDALWVPNAMGLRTSPGFAAEGHPGRVPPERTWADVYFYREDNVDLTPGSKLVAGDAVDVPGSRI